MRRIYFLCILCVALSLATCGGREDADGQAIGGDPIEMVPSDSASRRLWECLGELRRKGSRVHLHPLLTDVAAYDSGNETEYAHHFVDVQFRRNQAQAEHEKDRAAGLSCGLGSGDVLAEAVIASFRQTAHAVGVRTVSSSTSRDGDHRRVDEQNARLALALADQDADGAKGSSGRRCDYELTFDRRDTRTVLPGDVFSRQLVLCATVRNAAGKECSWTHSLSEGSAEDSLGLERKVEKVEFDMEEFVVALASAKSSVGERYEMHAYYDMEDRKFWFRWCRRI